MVWSKYLDADSGCDNSHWHAMSFKLGARKTADIACHNSRDEAVVELSDMMRTWADMVDEAETAHILDFVNVADLATLREAITYAHVQAILTHDGPCAYGQSGDWTVCVPDGNNEQFMQFSIERVLDSTCERMNNR